MFAEYSSDRDTWQSQSFSTGKSYEFAVQQFVSFFPAEARSELPAIEERISKLADQLPSEQRAAFLSFTLPQAASHCTDRPGFDPQHILQLLESASASGALGISLKMLLRQLENVPLFKVCGALESVAAYCGESSKKMFDVSLPALLENFGDRFEFVHLVTLASMSRIFKEDTPHITEAVCERLDNFSGNKGDLLEGLLLALEAGQKVNRAEAADCMAFCFDMAKLAGYKRISTEFWQQIAHTWQAWESGDRKSIASQLKTVLSRLLKPLDDLYLKEVLNTLAIPGERAEKIIRALSATELEQDNTAFMNTLRRIDRIEKLISTPYLEDAAYICALGEDKANSMLYDRLFSQLINTFGIRRLERHLHFVRKALDRLGTYDLEELGRELPHIQEYSREILISQSAIPPTPLNYLLIGIQKGGEEYSNPWKISEAEVFNRFVYHRNLQRTSILKTDLTDRISVRVTPEDCFFKLKEHGRLDENFIHRRINCFTAPYCGLEAEILNSVAEMIGSRREYSIGSNAYELLPMLVKASRLDNKVFKATVRTGFPLISSAVNYHLAHVDQNKWELDNIYDFLESLRLLIDDRLPVTFERLGMERKYIDQIKEIACLTQINSQLKQFTKQVPEEELDILFVAGKNVIDCYHDQMGQTCIHESASSNIEDDFFQPLRMVSLDHNRFFGCWYTLIGEVENRLSLSLAGGGPQGELCRMTDVNKLVRASMYRIQQIAVRSGLSRSLYQAVGAPTEKAPYSDEGRIAQHPEVRKALLRGASDVIEIDPIDFPRGYKYGPTKRVVKILG